MAPLHLQKQAPNPQYHFIFPLTLSSQSYWAFYPHGRFLPNPERCSLSGAHLCLYLSTPSSKVTFPSKCSLIHLTGSVHPSTSHFHPHDLCFSLDMDNQLHTGTYYLRTMRTALYLTEPQLYKFLLQEFPPSEEEYHSTNTYLCTCSQGNSKMNHS